MQINKEFSLNSEQCLETGKFTVPFDVFQQIFELISNVVGLILITNDYDKLIESDINEVLIDEQKREDDKTIIIPKGLSH